MKLRWGVWLGAALLAVTAMPREAEAQENEQNRVLLVPFSQRNPTLPHPAHEQARVTLKGIIRNATCNAGYDVVWDTNFNGQYDDWSRHVGRDAATNSVRDIGRTFLVPEVDRDTRLNVNVRVTNRCNREEKFATFRLFVYDFTPTADPRNWTDEQLEIMSLMAVQESLWYLHRTVTHRTRIDHTMEAHDQYEEATPITMWLFTINGHLPAYPPANVNNVPGAKPDGWVEDNRRRWNADPYAETVIRYGNYIVNRGNVRGIPGGEEDNTCGWQANGTERRCNRLANTNDNRGAYGKSSANVYRMGLTGGGIPTLLPALAGTQIALGPLRGQLWEWYVQQLVDQIGAQQIDGGCAMGGWLYGDFNGSGGCGHSDASTSQWSYIGLESAEIAGGPYGVFVNNRHKFRIAENLVRNQRADGGSGYRSSSHRGDIKLTGGALVGARWLGIHTFNRNGGDDIFRQYSSFTQGRLRQAYDTYVAYLARTWNEALSVGGHWQDSIWRLGDYLCGNTNAVYNIYRCGSTYAMYSLQKGFRTGSPELTRIGNNDWVRQFNTYYVRAQDRHANPANPSQNYSVTGRIYDQYCDNHSVTCSYGGGRLAAPMGGLVMTPTIFNPKPIPIAGVNPPEVTEGCAGGNNGRVTFNHDESFHPNQDSRIIAYQWDVDASNGLWWDTGADPDFQTADANDVFEHTYDRTGNYTATLRVVDNVPQNNTTTVAVRVNEAENVPPAAAHGGPYVIEVGQALELEGAGTDGNLGCGDRITINWDLDNNGQFNDANGGTPVVRWEDLDDLPVGQPNRIRVQVRDQAGETAVAETTLTIYPREPVARGRANPNPAACRVDVTFDGNASFHPNPQRTIAQYNWNVDGRPGNEGEGALFRYSYPAYGTYTVVLQVVDDLGRTATTEFEVEVNQGNNPPTARVAQGEIVVLEGDALQLDARTSQEPNSNCGDSITSFRWDINADGDFDDAVDVEGPNPTIEWDDLIAAGLRVADPETGEPTYVIRVQVTDEFGETATAEVRVTLLEARPEAIVVQSPDPALVRRGNGQTRMSLDGRESRSPVDGVGIRQYDWDLDDDGDFETLDRPVVDFIRVVPEDQRAPGLLPEYCVRLRVTDDTGRQSQPTRYCVNLTVPPTPPTADADPTDPPEEAYHILLGDGVTLDGSQSFDPDDDDFIEFYRWDLTYDEEDGFNADAARQDANGDQAEALLELTAQQLAGFGIDEVGEFRVRLQVEDNFQQTNTDDTTITVHPRNPLAVPVANPNPAACGARVTFDGSRSNHPHPSIEIQGYEWDFDGDGEFDAQGEVATHRYQQFTFEGPIQATLRVTDSNGNQGSADVPIRVDQGNRAPVAVAGGFRDDDGRVVGPYAIAVGDDLALSAAGSNDPDAECGDRIERYEWFLNADGNADAQGEEPELTWAQLNGFGIDEAGDYDIRLRVVDRFGVTAENVVTLRVVNGPNAVATASPDRTQCGNQVVFSGERSSTDGPNGQGFELVSYEWDLDGDGQYDDAEGPRVTRAAVGLPDDEGNIQVAAGLRVTDATGRVDTTTVNVVIDVQNLRPVANAGGPYVTGPLGNSWAPVRLDGRGSSDPNEPCDQVVTYRWDTDGDGRYGSDDQPDDLEGAFIPDYVNNNWRVGVVDQVRLIVCDAEGACSDPAIAEVTVLDEAPPAGQILTPRGDDDICVGGNNFDVTLDVSDPEGDFVTVTLVVAGREVGSRRVDTPNDGSPARVTLNVDPDDIPEGRHVIEAVFEDDNGAEASADSGGRITFDRTAPEVAIGNELGENVCFNPGRVPNPTISVDDELDQAPEVNEQVVEDGCGRTLQVVATDACGNEGRAERFYRLAQEVEVEIDGADEGELVADARMSWDVVGPDACAGDISATLQAVGGQPAPYAMNGLINQPGTYALRVRVENCQGVATTQTRNFLVNSPPVAVPIPADRVDPDNELTYTVAEGDGLQVDGSESQPPEEQDRIAEYQWDWNGDGQVDANGAVAAFPTNDDGRFRPTLTVVDSLGATHRVQFTVVVTDVSPVADAGGPYAVPQGAELVFDGRGSRPGSAADPIREYRWDFGDGSEEVRGADLTQPRHTYADNGAYIATLTVCDEDNCTTSEVRVEVRDVNPTVEGIDPPDPLYEIRPMAFEVNAEPGSPADPITRIEWDIDGDGEVDYAGADAFEVQHQFIDAGTYNVVVTVFDGDSETVEVQQVEVAEITLDQLVEWIGIRMEAAVDAGIPRQILPRVASALAAVDDARWGERHARRGNTMLAVDKIVRGMVALQQVDVDMSLELWALSRQLLREVTRQRDRLIDDPDLMTKPDSLDPAGEFIAEIEENFGTLEDPREEFQAAIDGAGPGPAVVTDVLSDAVEAYYWLTDASDPCNAYGGFPLEGNSPEAISRNAVETNADLVTALRALRADIVAYVNTGEGNNDVGPARDELEEAVDALDDILSLAGLSVQNPCPPGQVCVTDIEALRMEIWAMQLAEALIAAQSIGAWSRNWQSCLVLVIKFRIELSILRVESVCGRFNATSRRARAVQQVGLDLVADGANAAALEYYIDNERQCFMIEVLNECLAPAINGPGREQNAEDDETPNVLYPNFCPQAGEDGEDQPEGGVNLNNWQPPEFNLEQP